MFPSAIIVYEHEVAAWVALADQNGYDVQTNRELPRYYITFTKRVVPLPWWEVRIPPYDLVNPNAVIQFYDLNGNPFHSMNVRWTMQVTEVRGDLLKVWDQPDPTRPDWYVLGRDVSPA